jgi:hypothetical protein
MVGHRGVLVHVLPALVGLGLAAVLVAVGTSALDGPDPGSPPVRLAVLHSRILHDGAPAAAAPGTVADLEIALHSDYAFTVDVRNVLLRLTTAPGCRLNETLSPGAGVGREVPAYSTVVMVLPRAVTFAGTPCPGTDVRADVTVTVGTS